MMPWSIIRDFELSSKRFVNEVTVDQRSWRKNILEGVHVKKLELQCTLFNSELLILLKKGFAWSEWDFLGWVWGHFKVKFKFSSQVCVAHGIPGGCRTMSWGLHQQVEGLHSNLHGARMGWEAHTICMPPSELLMIIIGQLNRKHQLIVKTNSWRDVYPQVNLQNQPLPKNPLTSQP